MTSSAQKLTVSDGSTIAWEERGAGKPILLIMGLGAGRSAWNLHAQAFEKTFRCLIPDNRGIGDSSAPAGPYTTTQMADDHAAVIRAAGEERASVVGISLGGAIAQQLALRHPDLVEKLVLVSTWARCLPSSVDCFEELQELRPKLTPAEFTRRLQHLIWTPETINKNYFNLHDDRFQTDQWTMTHEAFSAQCEAALSHDTSAQLSEIAAPSLITVGTHDIFTPVHSSMELANGIPNSRLEKFTGDGHAHHWESLDRFNALCEEFLN